MLERFPWDDFQTIFKGFFKILKDFQLRDFLQLYSPHIVLWPIHTSEITTPFPLMATYRFVAMLYRRTKLVPYVSIRKRTKKDNHSINKCLNLGLIPHLNQLNWVSTSNSFTLWGKNSFTNIKVVIIKVFLFGSIQAI